MKEAGEVTFFSPLKDKELPKNIDFIYLGGGYPEVFIDELSENTSMLKSIKNELINGVKCYAECGGLMYLTKGIQDMDGNIKQAVGFFDGHAYMTKRLQNFGYASLEVDVQNQLLPLGFQINCHEFHKSYVDLCEDKIYGLSKNIYDGSIKRWSCGYLKNNALGAYGHVHFFGNLDMIRNLLK